MDITGSGLSNVMSVNGSDTFNFLTDVKDTNKEIFHKAKEALFTLNNIWGAIKIPSYIYNQNKLARKAKSTTSVAAPIAAPVDNKSIGTFPHVFNQAWMPTDIKSESSRAQAHLQAATMVQSSQFENTGGTNASKLIIERVTSNFSQLGDRPDDVEKLVTQMLKISTTNTVLGWDDNHFKIRVDNARNVLKMASFIPKKTNAISLDSKESFVQAAVATPYGSLQEHQDALQEHQDALKARQDALKERQDAFKARKDALQERQDALQERKDALQARTQDLLESRLALQELALVKQEKEFAIAEKALKEQVNISTIENTEVNKYVEINSWESWSDISGLT